MAAAMPVAANFVLPSLVHMPLISVDMVEGSTHVADDKIGLGQIEVNHGFFDKILVATADIGQAQLRNGRSNERTTAGLVATHRRRHWESGCGPGHYTEVSSS